MLTSLTLAAATPVGLGDATTLAILGYGVVFAGLIVLMLVIALVGKFFSRKRKAAAPVEVPTEEPAPVEFIETPAPGSAGELKLYDTPPKTAAMLMAIVADKLGKPLNELRFISIKEVK
ncbi:MAG: hypothetical protein E7462_06270 [Ruminococcaceae bacterium]|nr:hypothetical protein [Oscillospiraceae bacterium]